ncbi:MAG: helix-turn-helix transcriptional regulator [Clostridium sp.]|jgi:transcriptional regulator with XRE-family HTH domain|nr:helix-turn-helix transcriptional regulator [Clostridium sp.]
MFGSRLRAQRMKFKYTQQFMADTLDISLNAYQKYEQGKRFPSFDCLVKIADIFNVPTDYLLCRDDFLKSLGVSADEYL